MEQPIFDEITIKGITAFGLHGVYPVERDHGQEFTVDITMMVDTNQAASTDDLDYTVDYSQVAQVVSHLLSGAPVNLLETLAETIARKVLSFPRVEEVTLTLHKPQAPLTVKFSDLSLTIHRAKSWLNSVPVATPAEADLQAKPETPVVATVALGANLGDAPRVMAQTVVDLDKQPQISVTAVSGLFKTAPILLPGQAAQPDYYNAVIEVSTTLSPLGLLEVLQELEATAGRVRTEKWAPRTLDLDIVTYGDLHSTNENLILPHPRAHERAFVLQPWNQINPNATLGKHGRVNILVEQVKEQSVQLLAEFWVEDALAAATKVTEPVESPIFAEISGRRSAMQTDWVLTKHQIERNWELRDFAKPQPEPEVAVPEFTEIISGEFAKKQGKRQLQMPSWKRVVAPPEPRIVDEPAQTPDLTVGEAKTPRGGVRLRRRKILRPHPTGAIPVVSRKEIKDGDTAGFEDFFGPR